MLPCCLLVVCFLITALSTNKRPDSEVSLEDHQKMGGGSSVLSPELSACLTQPSLEKFHRMQAECEDKHMTPMEMYVYLTARYEELVQAEKEAVNALSSSLGEGTASPKGGRKAKEVSAPSIRPMGTKSAHPERAILSKQQSVKLEEEYIGKDILKELEDSNEYDLRPIYDPYVESVVGKVFNVVDDPQVQSVVNMLLESSDAHPTTSFVVDNSFVKLDNGSFECTVCRMKFEDRKTLDTHLHHSPIHNVNMRIRQEIFQSTLKEAERLAKLAQLTISKFHEKEPVTTAETPREGPESVARQRWKKAANKVICNRLKAQFLPIIEQICETPAGVRMLYAGSKFFYKAKVTFDLHIYLHIAQDIVEIVPHFIPGRKQRSSSIQPYPRLYLDFRILVPLVLGVDITNSQLNTQENTLSSFLPASNDLVSSVTSRVVALTASKQDGDHNLNKTIEQAITSFILNRLRVVQDYEKVDVLLTFDTQSIVNSPMLGAPPPELRPVPVSIEKIKSQYDERLQSRRRSKDSPTGSSSRSSSRTTTPRSAVVRNSEPILLPTATEAQKANGTEGGIGQTNALPPAISIPVSANVSAPPISPSPTFTS